MKDEEVTDELTPLQINLLQSWGERGVGQADRGPYVLELRPVTTTRRVDVSERERQIQKRALFAIRYGAKDPDILGRQIQEELLRARQQKIDEIREDFVIFLVGLLLGVILGVIV